MMKTRKFYCKILMALLFAGIIPAGSVLAQQYEKSRSLTRSFPVSEETSVQIINKYGNIHVLPWDEDSIRFEINIKVESNKESKVDKTYDDIDIEFSESSYYLIAQTVFGNQKSAFWADVTDFTSSMLKSGSNAKIDYTIYIPEEVELSLELKFGNIYMTDHSGKTTVYISNGDFRGGSFTELDLDHSFGNVMIESAEEGAFTLAYSEMHLKRAGELRITSKSSKPEIKSFSSLRINSKRDTWYLEKAGNLSGESSFSYITVESLDGDLILNTNYGNLSVESYGSKFKLMNLNASYTDVSLLCSKNPGYSFEAFYDKKTRMIYPTQVESFINTEVNSEDGEYLLSGRCGDSKEGKPRIKITTNGGSINLIQQ